MRRPAGQAFRVVRRLVVLAFSLCLIAALGLAALAWRLSQGPIEVSGIASRIESAFNDNEGSGRVTIGGAELSWDGWREGLSPFELRIRQVRLMDPAGRVLAELPEASVSLAYRWLLIGRLAPRRIELSGVRLRATRTEDGRFAVDLGGIGMGEDAAEAPPGEENGESLLDRLLAGLAEGQARDGPLGALERISVRDARIHVVDSQRGTEWWLEHAAIELLRHDGSLDLDGRGTLRLGEAEVPARLQGSLHPNPSRIEATLTLIEVRPALLARQAPVLAPLAALDATASVEIRVGARTDGGGASLGAVLHVGPGTVNLAAGGRVAIAGADISLIATPTAARLERAVLRFAPSHGAAALRRDGPVLSLAGEARREDETWNTTLRANIDWVPLPDLADHWPLGIARGAREWLTENLAAGMARNGRFVIGARMGAGFDTFAVTSLTGTMEAEDVTAHWLRPIAPVDGVSGTAEFGLDQITVRVRSGRQRGTNVQVRESTLRFGQFASGPGEADFAIRFTGPVPEVMALVRNPRLHIFDRTRATLPELTGTAQDVRLQIGFPLLAHLTIDDVRMRAEARLSDLRMPRGILGRDVERGTADLTVDMEGLRVQAQGTLVDIPVRLGVEMDFRAGAPGQLTSRETLSARADARQFRTFGLDLRDFVEGPVGIEARNESRRGQPTRLTIRGDLRESRMAVGFLGWQKPRGTAGTVEATLRIQGEQVQAMEQLRIEAPDGLVRARSGPFRNGFPERLEVMEGVLGATRFTGEARQPRAPGGDWGVTLRGPVVDLTAALADRGDAEERPRAEPEEGSLPVVLDWRFERAILGERRAFSALSGRARLDNAGVLREAEAQARFGNAGAQLRLTPDGTRRRVNLTSDDGGALLRLIDLVPTIDGGRLTVDATYEHGRPGAPLAGQAELLDFSVRNAPGLGKLLQAMTLFGLFDALSGPGLNFARLIAPFRLTPDALELDDARAFSASLGLTARGRLDRRRAQVDMDGTIVPAYFFNQILGNIPILGRLFSPEAGGGLFAATYRLRGPLADPNVSVNPLAALTPGFLRGIFQLGPEGQPRSMSPEVQEQGARSRVLQRAQQRSPVAQEQPLRGPPAN